MRVDSLIEQNSTTFGKPAIDYVTLTTYDRDAFKCVESNLSRLYHVPDRFRGYTGIRVGGLRMLTGTQMNASHYIMIGEGDVSGWLVDKSRSVTTHEQSRSIAERCRCTRIDFQLSVPSERLDFRAMTDRLKSEDSLWRRRGQRPNITLIQGEESKRGIGNTLYIGSRRTKNGYMTRLYEKRDEDGVPHVRFEVEMKGKPANKAFSQMSYGDVDIPAKVLCQVINTFPIDIVSDYLSGVLLGLSETEGYKLREKKAIPSDIKRVLWYRDDVAPCLVSMMDTKAIDFAIQETTVTLVHLLKKKAALQKLGKLRGPSAVEYEKMIEEYEEALRKKASEGRSERAEGRFQMEQGVMFDEDQMNTLLAVLDYESYHDVGL